MLIEVAPWKGHDGFCYLVLQLRAGCVPRKARGTTVLLPPFFGWTSDRRARTETATTLGGKRIQLTVQHFGGRVDATFFLVRYWPPRMLRDVVLRDAQGRVVVRVKR